METAASPSHAEPAAPSGAGPETAPEPETIASASGHWSRPCLRLSASESPLWSSSSPSPAPTAPPASSPAKGPRLRPGRRRRAGRRALACRGGRRSGNGAWLRRAAVAAAVVAVVAVLAVAGWQHTGQQRFSGLRPAGRAGRRGAGRAPQCRRQSPRPCRGSAPASPTCLPPTATPTSPAGQQSAGRAADAWPRGDRTGLYFAAITAHDYAKAWNSRP